MSAPPSAKSGAQKRRDRAQKQEKEETLVKKLPKLDERFFTPVGNIPTGSVCVGLVATEEDDTKSGSFTAEGDDFSDSTETENRDETGQSSSNLQENNQPKDENSMSHDTFVEKSDPLMFSTDPAKWKPNDELIDHLVSRKFPERNIQSEFPESRRIYRDRSRYLSKDLFQYKMQNGEIVQRDWMIYSKSTGCVFCFVCLLFAKGSKTAFSTGFNDWTHANVRATEHGNSSEHFTAQQVWAARRSQKARIDSELQTQFETECTYWRNVLKRVVSVIKFLTERGLALKGSNSTIGSAQNGNFLGVIELISQFDPFLAEHLDKHGNKGRGHPAYLSPGVCDEFIQCMSAKVVSAIVEEVKQSKYYSISVDSTPDISHTDQLTVILRYIAENGTTLERFVQFIDIQSHTSEYLATAVQKILSDLDIDINDCRGETFDNASNMSGKYSGLQQRLREVNPLIDFTPCSAHSLNLVGSCAAECCVWATSFFGFLQQLYNFFSASTHRWNVLRRILPDGVPVPKCLSGTRWCARADATNALFRGYKHIQAALQELESDRSQTPATRSDSGSLASQMDKVEIALLTVIWNALLERFNRTNKTLQSSTVDLGTVVMLYDSLIEFLHKLRDTVVFDDFESAAKELSSNEEYREERQRSRRRVKMFDKSESSESVQSPGEKFRITVYYVIIDSLSAELQRRRSAYSNISEKFGFLHNLAKLSAAELVSSANNLQTCYPSDLNDMLATEIIHFSSFAGTVDNQHPQNLLKTLRELNLRDTFPNVDISLRLYLCQFATNCTGERSFSALKRVKTDLRSTTSQGRMSALSLLCIESELVRSLSFDHIVDDFARSKSRRKAM